MGDSGCQLPQGDELFRLLHAVLHLFLLGDVLGVTDNIFQLALIIKSRVKM